MGTRENVQEAGIGLEESEWGRYCLTPSESQKIQFAKTGRIVFAVGVADTTFISMPRIDVSSLFDLKYKGEKVKPPQFAWLRTDRQTLIEVFVTSRDRGILPSRIVEGEKPGSRVPAKEVVSLQGRSRLHTVISGQDRPFYAKLVTLPNPGTNL